MGSVAPFSGTLFTRDAVNCMVSKYDWCVSAWITQLEMTESMHEIKDNFLTETFKIELNGCEKTKNECLEELNKSRSWWRNPWFTAAVGVVVGSVITGTVVYFVTK